MTTEQRTIEFHRNFQHPVRDVPQTLDRDEALLAFRLIEEELLELAEALFPNLDTSAIGSVADYIESEYIPTDVAEYRPDLIATADAVGDLDVVVNGFGIRSGFDMEALSRAVAKSNDSKLGADGKPIYHPNGKIAKGPDFKEPDIAGALGLN